jgi:serine/threonine protein kinase, bacterial
MATLTGSTFRGAKLRGTTFYKADLTRADFQGTNLTGIEFCAARLHGARMGETKLFAANLCGADLTGAQGLTSAQLSQARTDERTILPSGRRGPYLEGSGAERPLRIF